MLQFIRRNTEAGHWEIFISKIQGLRGTRYGKITKRWSSCKQDIAVETCYIIQRLFLHARSRYHFFSVGVMNKIKISGSTPECWITGAIYWFSPENISLKNILCWFGVWHVAGVAISENHIVCNNTVISFPCF